MSYNISAILLGAGTSSRFGNKNKLLQPFKNSILIEHIVKIITSVSMSEVLVVTGFEHDKVFKAIEKYDIQIVYNEEFETGIASSIKCGVLAASDETEGYMICLGDMPNITQEYILKLMNAFSQSGCSSIIVPAIGKRKGNPVIFPKVFRGELLQIRGDKGARAIIEKNAGLVVEVPIKEERLLDDIDTMEDLLDC